MNRFKGILFKTPDLPRQEMAHIVVDKELIMSCLGKENIDVQKIIEPLWWSVNIYGGEEQYENDLKLFTKAQRYIFAIQWYASEINNGGHCQFYDNPTGIVWEDALKGFDAMGASKNANIIRESANRLGGSPSKNQEERQRQLENYECEFNDLDKAYYETENEMIKLLSRYIIEHCENFIFAGDIIISNT